MPLKKGFSFKFVRNNYCSKLGTTTVRIVNDFLKIYDLDQSQCTSGKFVYIFSLKQIFVNFENLLLNKTIFQSL